MSAADPAVFHKLYGPKKPRLSYFEKDFVDYTVMLLLTAAVVWWSYGPFRPLALAGAALCAFLLATFAFRHGVRLRIPLLLRRPQDVLYMLVYKLQNLKPVYFMALGLLLAENVLIAATPSLPHHVETMRRIALILFYVHLGAITAFRTAILVAHLAKKELVREILIQTPWKQVINEKTNIVVEILHAYATGLLTHLVLIAPWYLVITHANFSALFLPVTLLAAALIHWRWMKTINAWFYRDHWLGHNSELEFVLLHGSHHDAIPCGLIAVAENGFLEGFFRFATGAPVTFYSPFLAFLVLSFEIKGDIDLHQYIPGIFPRLPREALEVGQHSTHHYGRLEPYSIGLRLGRPEAPAGYKRRLKWVPDELMNSLKLDEELTGFEWDNATHRNVLRVWDQYERRSRTSQTA